MHEHKLQSSEGVPNLQLALVPKMLTPLVRHWVRDAFIVSFKLETDQDLLVDKAKWVNTLLDFHGYLSSCHFHLIYKFKKAH